MSPSGHDPKNSGGAFRVRFTPQKLTWERTSLRSRIRATTRHPTIKNPVAFDRVQSSSSDRTVVYLTRRNVVTFVPPTDAWSVQDISLPVYDVSGRFCSVPVQAGQAPC